jgi:starch phosphorylase
MVRDYAQRFYIPAFERGQVLVADGMARAVALAKAKDSMRHRWNAIRIVGVHTSGNGHFKVGDTMQVEAMVDLPGVDPAELTVQLYTGPVTAQGEIEKPQALQMTHARAMAPDRHVFVGQVVCRASGRQGFAIRVLPGYKDMATPFEPGLIIWN